MAGKNSSQLFGLATESLPIEIQWAPKMLKFLLRISTAKKTLRLYISLLIKLSKIQGENSLFLDVQLESQDFPLQHKQDFKKKTAWTSYRSTVERQAYARRKVPKGLEVGWRFDESQASTNKTHQMLKSSSLFALR